MENFNPPPQLHRSPPDQHTNAFLTIKCGTTTKKNLVVFVVAIRTKRLLVRFSDWPFLSWLTNTNTSSFPFYLFPPSACSVSKVYVLQAESIMYYIKIFTFSFVFCVFWGVSNFPRFFTRPNGKTQNSLVSFVYIFWKHEKHAKLNQPKLNGVFSFEINPVTHSTSFPHTEFPRAMTRGKIFTTHKGNKHNFSTAHQSSQFIRLYLWVCVFCLFRGKM